MDLLPLEWLPPAMAMATDGERRRACQMERMRLECKTGKEEGNGRLKGEQVVKKGNRRLCWEARSDGDVVVAGSCFVHANTEE
uniref:Uncharacterized protein n=1 Tax=Setaria viridis TaxID=4556 RepID=A0A4U6TE77_SETVI|nr:hypothetical protein SEVIR_8G006300v2 [Setaria viridis]